MPSDNLDELVDKTRRAVDQASLLQGIHPDQRASDQLRSAILAGLSDPGAIKALLNTPDAFEKWVKNLLAYIERIAGGVYSDSEILGAIRRGNIICHPLVPANIKGSSVDVTLGGDGFFVANANKSPIYDHRNPEDIERFFRAEKPKPHREFCESNGLGLLANLPDDALVIPVFPGERIMAHTHEFIGILPPGTTSMQSRSTIGRNGIAVCIDAGWGDPGYATRWTMEIHNFNQELCILAVGDRIAQIVFHHTGAVLRPYGGTSSKYHTASDSLEKTIADWSVKRMIPRADKDEFVAPLPLLPIPDYSIANLEEG